MPLELFLQCGLLLVAVAAAFAISSAVGMLVAHLWAEPPVLPPTENLTPLNDPAT